MENAYAILGVICISAIIFAIYILRIGNGTAGQGQEKLHIIEGLLSMVAMYIFFPLLCDLLKK